MQRWLTPALLLFGACLVYSVGVASIGFYHPIVEDHGFRQTQTAISTFYMVGKPPELIYETPVLGRPWAVPFEFPLYQWLVAGLVTALGTDLDATGRLVSLVFFLLCLIPGYVALGSLGLSRDHRLIMLSLFLVSPFYVFWSRTFLIESTVLFLSLCFLACALRCLEAPRRWLIAAAIGFGILASVVKITTFAVFFLAVGLALACRCLATYRQTRSFRELARLAWPFLPILLLPVLAGLWWTRLTDQAREANLLGQHMTSRAMKEWTLGTLEQRLSAETWLVILSRLGLMVGQVAVLALCLIGLASAGRRRWQVAACLLLALSGPLIFTNLHYVHEYYAYANGIFLIAAVGLSLVALLEKGPALRMPALGAVVVLLAVGALCHRTYYYPKQAAENQEIRLVGEAVQQATQPEDVILVVGCDWSPEVPYYSRRRALMLPNWKTVSWDDLPLYLDPLKSDRLGAVVVGPAMNGHDWKDVLQRITTETNTQAVSRYRDEVFQVFALTRKKELAGAPTQR
jgi:hypothetical protein